jgi:protein-disulfide isomerase
MSRRTRKPVPVKGGLSANVIVSIVVAALAILIIGGALLANRSDDGGSKNQVSEQSLRKPDSHTISTAADGKVTVVEFLDYQCPACAGFYANVTKKLVQDYNGRITFVTRNFPLDNVHPLAVSAAQAAEAAGAQGKYTEMYHALYDNYESWAVGSDGNVSNDEKRARSQFDKFASQIGLNLNKFHQDIDSDQIKQRVSSDRKDGENARVSGTPTFFINGARFTPKGKSYADVTEQFRKELDAALKK